MKNLLFSLMIVLAAAAYSFGQPPSPTPDSLAAEKQRADRLQARLSDYAQLVRCREANAATPAPGKDENRVVFLGDSITDSWKLAEYFPGQPFINRGISGQTTPQMLIRMRPDVIALKPRLLVVLAGTNDIAGNLGAATDESIKGSIESIVELAHANGIKVVLASILPVSDYNTDRNGNKIVRTVLRPPARIIGLNNWIRDYCQTKRLVYLDYYSQMIDEAGFLKAELANDGLHPNAAGYKVMQKLAAEAIAIALKRKQFK